MTDPFQTPGQAIWLEGISRALLESGDLARLVASGKVCGGLTDLETRTQAAQHGQEYRTGLRPMAQAGWAAERALDALRVEEARAAADVFLPLFERTNGKEGYLSVPATPATSAEAWLAEARRFWGAINRPNVMLRAPATPDLLAAFEHAVADGLNLDVGWIYSLERHADVVEAYTRGLEARLARGEALDHVASVASIGLSRIDLWVKARLQELARSGSPEGERAANLTGRIAVAMGKLILAQYKAAFEDERFAVLARHGAHPQRLAWAARPDEGSEAGYLADLAGPDTICILSQEAVAAFGGAGWVKPAPVEDLSAARAHLEALGNLGVSLADLATRLETEATRQMETTWRALINMVRREQAAFVRELGPLGPGLRDTLEEFEAQEVGRRLWQGDATLWSDEEAEAVKIRERLGWLTLPETSPGLVENLEGFAAEVQAAGLRQAVLLGMGGSSLAPSVIRRMLGRPDGMRLHVLDSTDPAIILEVVGTAPVEETLFIVASKSGTTTEPLALMEHFWSAACDSMGTRRAGEHFVAVTDPGTQLEALAQERGFRRVFSSPADVGGRYSALCVFGLLPAALMNIDLRTLLRGGGRMAHACGPAIEPTRNPGLFLGAVLTTAARKGRDKLTFLADAGLAPLEDWIEQLVAESSGKEGKGILPVVAESPGPAQSYRADRLLVYLRQQGGHDSRVRGWARAGIPVAVVQVGEGAQGLGAEFLRWEIAVAAACHGIGVNAFDQPDVQRAKERTVDLLKAYLKRGVLPEPPVLWQGGPTTLWGGAPSKETPPAGATLEAAVGWMLGQVHPGDAFLLLLYLPHSQTLEQELTRLQVAFRKRTGCPMTIGFGPRYLHSTGQIHKGGPDRLVSLILTPDPRRDLPVPGRGYTFGILERAQAVGDLMALGSLGRRAYALHLDRPGRVREVIAALQNALGAPDDSPVEP